MGQVNPNLIHDGSKNLDSYSTYLFSDSDHIELSFDTCAFQCFKGKRDKIVKKKNSVNYNTSISREYWNSVV
jgi:hypothetical protein